MDIRCIALFGASNSVGERVLDASLRKGMRVRALAGEPERQQLRRGRAGAGDGDCLSLVAGDVLDVASVRETLAGQRAAVVALGYPVQNFGDYTEAIKNIVTAMESLNIKFISTFLAGGSKEERQKALMPLESSELMWVAASAPGVSDQQRPSGYLVGRSGSKPQYTCDNTSAADLSQFLIDSLGMPELYQRIVQVYSRS